MFPDANVTTLNMEQSIDKVSSSARLNAIKKEVKDFSQLAPSKTHLITNNQMMLLLLNLENKNRMLDFFHLSLIIIKMNHLLMLFLRKNQLNIYLRTIVNTTVEQGNVIDNLSSSTSTSANNPLNKALDLASKF